METLFDSACRYMSDSELIYEITNNKKLVTEAERQGGEYDLNGLFSSLTPGRKKVATAAIELYKRLQSRHNGQDAIRCSQDIDALIHPFLWDLPNEELWVIALNTAAKVIKKVRVSVGGISRTAVDVRLIMRILVEASATQFAVVHNHPSGSKHPSREDENVTERLKKAGTLFDIRMIDHIIIAGDTYYSFADEGRLYGGRVRGGARFRLLAHSQTETGVKRYFFYFSVPSTTEGQSQILNGIKKYIIFGFFLC